MSHGENIGQSTKPPCWQCQHFVALGDGGATCAHGDQVHMAASPQRGCAFHRLDPARAGSREPARVSFLDAWRLVPRHIARPPEVLAVMAQEFRVMVATGDAEEAPAWAVLDRASRKRRITVVIHAGDALAKAWAMRNLREHLDYADPMAGRPHAVIALPGGVDQVAVREARAAGLPVWAPDRQAVARIVRAGQTAEGGAIAGWRNGAEHQWSRDPGRGRRYR